MHIAVAIEAQTERSRCHHAIEKVSVRHIRLLLPRQRVSAKVGTFFAADQVLLTWALRTAGVLECEFEIVYDDGQTLAGEYHFKRKAANRPALMGFIRKSIQALSEGGSTACALRGLSACPQRFLAQYETDDFTFTQ